MEKNTRAHEQDKTLKKIFSQKWRFHDEVTGWILFNSSAITADPWFSTLLWVYLWHASLSTGLHTCLLSYLSTCLHPSFSTCPHTFPLIHMATVYRSTSLASKIFVFFPVYIATCAPVHLYTCTPVHQSPCQIIYLSIFCICMPVHFSALNCKLSSFHLDYCTCPRSISTCSSVYFLFPRHLSISKPAYTCLPVNMIPLPSLLVFISISLSFSWSTYFHAYLPFQLPNIVFQADFCLFVYRSTCLFVHLLNCLLYSTCYLSAFTCLLFNLFAMVCL
jgi:hypothetical protein